MPPSKKKRSRHVEFDEYVPPDTLHVEEPVVLQERHTHYELHGRAVHSLLTVPASPPSTDLASDDFNFASDDLDRAIEETCQYNLVVQGTSLSVKRRWTTIFNYLVVQGTTSGV